MTLVYPPDDFEAYLTAVLETWVHRAPEWPIVAQRSGEDWFGPEGPRRAVVADPEAAHRVAKGVENHAGREAWLVLGQAFRYSGTGKEALLAEYIRLCIRHGRTTLERLDPEVREVLKRARAVKAEAHRYLGLLRFQAVGDQGWYARYGPDHDVTGLLVGPFHQRMAGLDWMIHDLGRAKAWVCRGGVGQGVTGVTLAPGWTTAPTEASAQDLWRRYFETIAVPGRTNPGLQRSKMPQKTWKHLVERPGPLRTP